MKDVLPGHSCGEVRLDEKEEEAELTQLNEHKQNTGKHPHVEACHIGHPGH